MYQRNYPLSRRRFIQVTSLATISSSLKGQQIMGANSRVRLAVLGCGIRGTALLSGFSKIPGVEIVAISDPDIRQMAALMKKHGENIHPVQYQDYRKVLDRDDIDAVVIATPNYWHALMSIQAVQAGKHVYVEKPVTFTLWEGLQLEAAERKYGKIIVPGHQNRSDKGPQTGIQYVKEGNLGKIKKIRSMCCRNRTSIGKLDQPLKIPTYVDYNLWLGPAKDIPIMRPELQYDWHWVFNTGNGEIGNQGVHEVDLVCWALGDQPLPSRIQSFGNRFAWDDAGNTPNMQAIWYKAGDIDVILEVNDLWLSPERNVSYAYKGIRVGILIECENGYIKGGRGGMVATELDARTIIEKFPGDGGRDHQNDFINAIIANDSSISTAQVSDAQKAASIGHIGDISYRAGETVSVAELEDTIAGNEDLLGIVAQQRVQLKDWGINDPKYKLGVPVNIDPATQQVTTKGIGPDLTGPHYRNGFELKPLV